MSVFRTAEGRDRVRAHYQGILDQFPVRQRYVDAPGGRTFAIEAGAMDAPPVVLLHGASGNSAFWLGDILRLAAHFRTIAVDIPGEAGLSDENRLDFESDACARWLEAVLDALAVPRAALVGNSFGGWMALKFAVTRPERVAKLVPVVASGIVPPSPMFQAESLVSRVDDIGGRAALNEAVTRDAALPEPVAVFLQLIGENFRPETRPLPLFPDAALQALAMPALFLFAERDTTMDARAAASRVETLLPHARSLLLHEHGHIVTDIAERALPFLTEPMAPYTLDAGGVKVMLIDRWARVPSPRDMLDAMATAGYLGCDAVMLRAESLAQAFFDLKTGVAGEMLQKFSNYRMKLAIIGDFTVYKSRSLRDFIRESNGGKTVFFVDSVERALAKLSATAEIP